MSDEQRYISHSELWTWKRCHRKWYLTYFEGLRDKKGEERVGIRRIGTRIHIALAAHYTPGLPYDRRANAGLIALKAAQYDDLEALKSMNAYEVEPGTILYSDENLKQAMSEFDLEEKMLLGYHQWLEETGADEDIEPLSAEERVTEAAVVGVKKRLVHLSGTLDLRIKKISSGILLLFDHKTVGTLKQPTLHMSTQLKHYVVLDRLRGHVTSGALFNMLRKVKRTASANPPFYGREEVRFNDEELRAYWLGMGSTIDEITEAETRLERGADHHWVTPPNVDPTCSWQCDFFEECPMMDDGSRWRDLVAGTHVRIDARHTYRDNVIVKDEGDAD